MLPKQFPVAVMKKLFKGIARFTRREWFLITMVITIALIIILFEVL
jgi:cell division protein FtsL